MRKAAANWRKCIIFLYDGPRNRLLRKIRTSLYGWARDTGRLQTSVFFGTHWWCWGGLCASTYLVYVAFSRYRAHHKERCCTFICSRPMTPNMIGKHGESRFNLRELNASPRAQVGHIMCARCVCQDCFSFLLSRRIACTYCQKPKTQSQNQSPTIN